MADSSPEGGSVLVTARALVVGCALGVVAASAASLVVAGATSLAREATGLVATLLAALAAGIWAGAPGAQRDELPLRERWTAAGLATALAGTAATAIRLFGYIPGGPLGRTLALIVLAGLPVYTMGLVMPVLLAWGERWEEEPGWGPVGGLAIGMLAGAAVGLAAAGLLLIPWLSAGPLLLAASILLLVPLVMGDPEPPEPDEVVLYDGVTPFSTLQVTELDHPGAGQPERRLYLNGEEESAELIRSGAPALAYVAAAESWLTTSTPRGSSMLFLGGGAYTLPRRMAERDPRAAITVVELDPEVTRVAYQFFGVRREHAIRTVTGDARAFVESAAERYDRVYVDVYGGTEALPLSLVSREGLEAVAGVLRPGGVAAFNVIGSVVGPESVRLWSVVRTFAQLFPSVALYSHLGEDFPDRQNLLLAGSLDSDHSFPARAGLFEPWPADRWLDPPGVTIYRDLGGAEATGDGAADEPLARRPSSGAVTAEDASASAPAGSDPGSA